jgi:SHS2 domain-containing protein
MDYWEHFAHGADVGIRGVGSTMAEAFAQAALALTAAVCDVTSVRPVKVSEIVCRAPSPELLLVDLAQRRRLRHRDRAHDLQRIRGAH